MNSLNMMWYMVFFFIQNVAYSAWIATLPPNIVLINDIFCALA